MNKVKFGLCNVHIAPYTISEQGVITYDTPFELPGAVNLTLDPAGDSEDFHADNTIYFSDTANNGYTGSLEIARVTDEFRTKVLGEYTDANGALIENKNDIVKPFALGFQIEGDKHARRFWYYNNTVTRPSNNTGTTENSKQPKTDTLNIKAMPRITDGEVRAMLSPSNSNTTAYNSFFTSVYEKVTNASV